MLLGVLLAGADAPLQVTLDSLLKQFQAVPGLEAHFREEKHISLLAAPLVTEGTLYFAPPDRLARWTSAPTQTAMVINGATLSFNDGHTTESMSFDANPVARLFVDSFLKILVGDAAALSRLYDMTFTPGKEGWTLHLKPKIEPMSKIIDAIDLDGDGIVLKRMRVLESGGDETITTFTAVDTHRRFTADELSRLFSDAAP